MDLANLTGHLLEVTIGEGAEAQDWSQTVGPFKPGYESLDTGDIATRATLVVLDTGLAPESLDVSENPARWRPGMRVKVRIPNSSGTYVDHPQGHLYILRDPQLPKDRFITLELGCWLLWGGTTAPEGDASAISYGIAETCDVIASRLLQAADVPPANISLSTWPYSLAVPIPNQSGSYPAQATDLAYSNGWRYLYQDSAGVVRDRQLSLAAGLPQVTITLGTDDAGFERFRDVFPPFELTRAAGEGVGLSQVTTPITSTSTEQVALDSGQADRTTFTSESYTYNPTTLVQTVSESRVTEDYDLITWAGKPPTGSGSATADRAITTATWEPTTPPPHRLIQEVAENRRARGIDNPNEVNNQAVEDEVGRVTRTPTYGPDGQIIQMQVIERAAEGVYDKASSNPYFPRTAKRHTTTWTEVSKGRWQQIDLIETARIVQNPGTRVNKWSMTAKRIPRTASDGTTTPPQPDFYEGPYTETIQEISGEATWVHTGGTTGRTRKDLKQIPYGFSDAQMVGLAELHRDLAIARQNGAIIPLPITDSLLAIDYPLFQVNVTRGDTTWKYLADGLQYDHQYEQSRAGCTGILIEKVTT